MRFEERDSGRYGRGRGLGCDGKRRRTRRYNVEGEEGGETRI